MERRDKRNLAESVVGSLAFLCTVILVMMIVFQSSSAAKITTGCLLSILLGIFIGLKCVSGCRFSLCPRSEETELPTRHLQQQDITLTRFDEETWPAPSVAAAVAVRRGRPAPSAPICRPSQYDKGPPPDYRAAVAAAAQPPPSYTQAVDLAEEAASADGGRHGPSAPPREN